MTDSSAVTQRLATADQQHLLFLFLPVKAGNGTHVTEKLMSVFKPGTPGPASQCPPPPVPPPDIRPATGVHFAFFYNLAHDAGPQKRPQVPTFTTYPGRDLAVVLSIYDRDFAPYIEAFTQECLIAEALDLVISSLDEDGLVDPDDPSSAKNIILNGGVGANPGDFIKLLMRYNFSDPTIPAATSVGINPPDAKFTLLATFPGLTVGQILSNYPNAEKLWPADAQPIDFVPSVPPKTN